MRHTQNLNKKAGSVVDTSEGWKIVRDYIISRLTERYTTMDDLKDDSNKKFKQIMQDIQTNYTRWFDTELLQNLNVYGIEILGEDTIVEDNLEGDVVDDTMDEGNADGQDEMGIVMIS